MPLVGVAGYHLFPDLIGGKNEQARIDAIKQSQLVLSELMKIRDGTDYIAGDKPTLADFYLAPMCFYVSLTEDAAAVFDAVDGFAQWWQCVQELPCYKTTEPDLG